MIPVLAADIGGTRLKLGLVDAASGRVLARRVLPAHAGDGLAADLPAVVQAWTACCAEADVRRDACRGIGIGLPCLISRDGRRVLSAAAGKFADAPSLDLPAWGREQLGLPLRLDNDARCFLAGELAHGALRGQRDAAGLILGTGIGTALAIDGRLVRGAHGHGGILGGHITLQLDGAPCICGRTGCAETLASGWALARDGLTLAALTGDPAHRAFRARHVAAWGEVLVTCCHLADPAAIVIGGGVVAADPTLVGDLRDHVAGHLWQGAVAPQILPAALGEDGPLLGAAAVAMEEI